jgi:hypothetical protein
LRSAWFLRSVLVSVLFLLIPNAAFSRGSGGGHGGHFGGGHGFHAGRGRHFHGGGFVFLAPFDYGFAPDSFYPGGPPGPLAPPVPFGCDDGLGGPSCSLGSPGGGGAILQSGPSLPEITASEIDLTKAHWKQPEPGECPPDQKLLRLPGQSRWRCADPRVQPAETLYVAP